MKSSKSFLLSAAALAAALLFSGCATTIDYGDPTSAKPPLNPCLLLVLTA